MTNDLDEKEYRKEMLKIERSKEEHPKDIEEMLKRFVNGDRDVR